MPPSAMKKKGQEFQCECQSIDKTNGRTGTCETRGPRVRRGLVLQEEQTLRPLQELCNQEIMPAATIMSPWRPVRRAIDGGRCPGTPLPLYRARIGR
jgi:hypothetical protein